MSQLKPLAATLILCLLGHIGLLAQANLYELNTNKGLPSNHVYYTLKDRHGYLWIATNKGVVKYNGYGVKTFGLDNGIANDDIWHLYEDMKGRIWLSSVSSDIGYIYEDKYHKATLRDNALPMYPIYPQANKNGIQFMTSDRRGKNYLCVEKNDTISSYLLPKKLNDSYLHRQHLISRYLGSTYKTTLVNNKLVFKKICNTSLDSFLYLYDKYLVQFPFKSDGETPMYIFNTETCALTPLLLDKDENTYMLYEHNGNCYLTSNKHVYELTREMAISKKKPVDELLANRQLRENDILTFTQDSFWKTCISTNSKGLLLNFPKNNFKMIDSGNYLASKHIGTSANGSNYWWNKFKRTLITRYANGTAVTLHLPHLFDIHKIVPYNKDSSAILAMNGHSWLFDKTNKITSNINIYPLQTDGTLYDSNTIFTVAVGSGIYRHDIDSGKFTPALDDQRYAHILYDSFHKAIWAYDNKRILVYNKNTTLRIPHAALGNTGIKKIEKLLVDNRYGNILIKSSDELWLVNIRDFKCSRMFPGFNLSSSHAAMHKGMLVVAGRFGILCSKINGRQQFSRPYLIPNVKNTVYNFVSDLSFADDMQVEFNTDKGLLSATLPPDSVFTHNTGQEKPPYRLLINYKGNTYNHHPNDTLHIDQKTATIRFDFINPAGWGEVKYRYFIQNTSTHWEYLNSNELHLPALPPGQTHVLYISAGDDNIRSQPARIHLYVIPYWWQTTGGIRIIWFSAIAAAALLVYLIVYITKRNVSKKHMEHKMQLELKNLQLAFELKSIYSQINPHFIFNTLSTGLYFIRKKRADEAYNHISSFSDLLRAYIKSSRSKYITIAEEVTNLANYISLQQARFENKFDYHIIIGDSISASGTYIPTLLLQPLVENAINHGLLPIEDRKGTLTIEFKKGDTGEILCVIDDDGIGREQSKQYTQKSKLQSESYGTELIKELIEVFNKNEHIHISLHYIDKTPPLHGTTVIITIKHKDHGQ